MKKMFALVAICVMASSLMAVNFTDANYKNGALTVPVVYTGMLKITGWGDEGLCYNWQPTRNSYPLFLGLCQPCLDCVPCDIDMRHLAPTIQNGDNSDMVANAVPGAVAANVDQTEAFFNRARLYLVNEINTSLRTATVKVIDLIDAYWGKDGVDPFAFQFYNTVDSKGRVTANAAYGRIAAFYSFTIYSRDYLPAMAAYVDRAGHLGPANVIINQYNSDGNNEGHTNTHQANGRGDDPCVADRIPDGIGLAALIGTKDYKAFFKVDGVAYPLVSIKAFTGDFFAWQTEYTDNNVDANAQPQYVCRKGEDYISYKNAITVPDNANPEFDGKGAWYATGSIVLRRNDAVTKRMMADLNSSTTSVTCIPCNQGVNVPVCREYLDTGVVAYLINRQFNNWALTYVVDLDNDGIYGEDAACGGPNEAFATSTAYLQALVNTTTANDATVSTYNLPAESANLAGTTAESTEEL